MFSSLRKLFEMKLGSNLNRLSDFISKDGFCSFTIKFSSFEELSEMLQAILVIQHEDNVHIELKMENTTLCVSIEYLTHTNPSIIQDLIKTILQEESKITSG